MPVENNNNIQMKILDNEFKAKNKCTRYHRWINASIKCIRMLSPLGILGSVMESCEDGK